MKNSEKRTLYLIPPSEWKCIGWVECTDKIRYNDLLCVWLFPTEIARNASEKDLKCTWRRYQQWVELNALIEKWPLMHAKERYTWVMYKAIDCWTLTEAEQVYFDDHVCIVSGYYWLLRPTDLIANYKLPLWAKWLKTYWKSIMTDVFLKYCQDLWITEIIDLLPKIHQSIFDRDQLSSVWITRRIQAFTTIDEQWHKKLLTHASKKIKWERLRWQIIEHAQIKTAIQNT